MYVVIDQAVAESVEGPRVSNVEAMSVHAVWGAITGTLSLEANNDPDGFPGNWVPVSVVEFEPLIGVEGEQIVEISNMRSGTYRVVYDHDSGVGPLRVVVKGKRAD